MKTLVKILAVFSLLLTCLIGYQIWTRNPFWVASDSGGKLFVSSDYDGKLVLLFFWDTHEPETLGKYMQLQQRFGSTLQVVGVALDDFAGLPRDKKQDGTTLTDHDIINLSAERYRPKFPLVLANPEVRRLYRLATQAVLIAPDGRILRFYEELPSAAVLATSQEEPGLQGIPARAAFCYTQARQWLTSVRL